MKLHGYWRSSCSWRVRIALGLKGLAYEYVPVHLLKGEQHEQGHVAKNPMQQVPVLELELGGKTHRLGQSLAIIEFLEERFPEPALLPNDPIARARTRQLAEIVNSGIQPLQNLAVLEQVALIAPSADKKAWCAHFVGRGLDALEALAQESSGRYLVGNDVTLADVCLVPQLYGARRFGVALDRYPRLTEVEGRLAQIDAFEQAHADRQPDAVGNQ